MIRTNHRGETQTVSSAEITRSYEITLDIRRAKAQAALAALYDVDMYCQHQARSPVFAEWDRVLNRLRIIAVSGKP